MTELIVTPSLISDISSLNKELKIKSNIEKLTYEEFKNENSISLFENDTYKFIYDQYVSYSELKKFNYNFSEKYIFQIKKQNLSKFSSENKEIKIHYLEPKKEKEIFPWDFTKILFSSKIKLSSDVVDHFCNSENTFMQFLSYFQKELIRLKLTFLYEDDEISNLLNEKIDYKIVGKDEADLNKKLIYFKSPIGKGLIGKNKKDLVEIKTPAGVKNFEIINVKYV